MAMLGSAFPVVRSLDFDAGRLLVGTLGAEIFEISVARTITSLPPTALFVLWSSNASLNVIHLRLLLYDRPHDLILSTFRNHENDPRCAFSPELRCLISAVAAAAGRVGKLVGEK
jgi:hypothetical protein